MKTRLLLLPLLTLASMASLSNAQAMGKKLTYQLHEATLRGESLSLKATDPKGVTFEIGRARLGCVKLVRGANLSSCLVSCDGKAYVRLAAEPVYEDIYRELSIASFSGTVERRVTVDPGVSAVVRMKGKNALPKLLPPVKPSATDPCSPLAAAKFDAEACLTNVNLEFYAPSGGVDNPIDAYRKLLHETVSSNQGDELEAVVLRLDQTLGLVQRELSKAGLDSFLRGGFFVAANLKNAPALVCQLRSRAFGFSGPDQTLRAALGENQAELERSLDFLERLGEELLVIRP